MSDDGRFRFGDNWRRFLSTLNEDRIRHAERSLLSMLDGPLTGRRFLDVGSGSGLSSLVARRLGAKVHSFDLDAESVACTEELKRRYFPDDPDWTVAQGSALDVAYVRSLGTFDVVYSWGVLHHTGAMWQALDHISHAVAPGGRLFVAIYNDQGRATKIWTAIKRTYAALPRILKLPFALSIVLPMELGSLAYSLLTLRPMRYVRFWTDYHKTRGMSRWYDHIDWIGGWPFEVASPEQIFDFYRTRGYTLLRMRTCAGGHGNNEFVFERARTT
jgi:SAM-dependent methyltransferase